MGQGTRRVRNCFHTGLACLVRAGGQVLWGMRIPRFLVFLALLFPGTSLLGLETFPAPGMAASDHELVIPIEVQSTSTSPAGITFKIHKTTYALDVYRKNPGSTMWGLKLATIPAGSATWTDSTAVIGTAYEYRFHAQNVPSVQWFDDGWAMATGHHQYANTYVLAGIEVDRTGSRGRVVLVMPSSIQTPLATEIARFKQDLVGDGWTVHDVLTPDGRTDFTCTQDGHHVQIRNDIIAVFNAHPGEVKHVILLGRVPQPRSGLRAGYASDGHSDLGANAADAYYADVNNTWTDTGEITVPTGNSAGQVRPEWRNVPGDGRFDQTHFRHLDEAFEMGWGRIDFRGAVNGGDEIGALRAYLNKLHDYKHAQNGFKPGRRSVMMDGGALFKHVQEEFFKNIPQLSGLSNIDRITYSSMPNVAWQPEAQYTADNGPYLYAFTAGNEPNKNSNMARAVFWTAAKSGVSYWDTTSWMRERIAEPNSWALSWTSIPARGRYVYHKMGLGGTIGDMMKATINNRDNETGLHGSAVRNYINGAWTVQNPVGGTEDYSGFVFNGHIGDPTLRDQMIESPAWIRGRLQGGGAQVQVEWLASPDATHGYDIYSGSSLTGHFTKRNGSSLHVNVTTGELSWTDTAPPSDPVFYMVRARKLEQTPSGSFFNASVGRMAEVDRSPAAFAIATTSLPKAYLDSEYDHQLQTSGGNPPAAWTILSGSLPSGLSMNPSGRITGTPTNAGSFPLTLRATDLQGTIQQVSLTLAVDMFHAWTLLPNGDLQSAPTYSGTFNQSTTNNWHHIADPNTQWTYDAANQWSQTFRTGRTGAQPGIGYVIPDLKTRVGAVAFRLDVKNTDGSGTPARIDYRIYGINGSWSWDYWNYGSNPTGNATLLLMDSIAGDFDWTTFETPALPVGSGYDYYVLRFMPSNVDSDLGDFMAIDNLRWSAAQPPPAFYDLTFAAGPNGSLTGDLNQTVVEGGSATTVTAVPAEGYELANWTWSGGSSTANPLTLTNVVANLAVTANFQLFNHPPTSTISSPANAASFLQGTAVTFAGTGSDPEDGSIASATWSSSIDGTFSPVGGTYSQLSAGTHTITRTVTDSGGKSASATITLTINPIGIFSQNFNSSAVVANYIGSASNLFDYIGTDTNATNNRATLSIADGRFRNTIAYTDDGNTAQLSAMRLTRTTDLPVEDNFAVVSATARLAPQNWPSADTNYLSFTIGQNFRTGIFTPSSGTGNGPAFATLTFQARSTANTFRTTGAGGNSANFAVTPSGGVYTFDLVIAANAGAAAQTFLSPTGSHTVQPGRLSAWINGALRIDNTSTGITATNLRDFSFSTGSGTASAFAAGSVFNGTYELDDVLVRTVSNFAAPPNTAPTVAITAPANATSVTQGASVTFTGTATDAQDGNLAASATWTSSLDGLIGSGGSVSTTTLSVGTHTITFAATDSGGLADSEQITLTVITPYAAWTAAAGLSGGNTLPDADLLGDGMTNLLRYALGGTPTTPAGDLAPVLTAATNLEFTFERVADPALTYEVWASNDLVNWGGAPIWSSTGAQNTEGEITVTDPAPISENPRRFLQLRVRR